MKKLLITAALALTAVTSSATGVVVLDDFSTASAHGHTVSSMISRIDPSIKIEKLHASATWTFDSAINAIPKNTRTVVNVSMHLTGESYCYGTTAKLMSNATQNGAVFVIAAGNVYANSLNTKNSAYFPTNCPNVVVVGSQENEQIADYSKESDVVDVYVPVPSLGLFSPTLRGTSFSATVVTALIANWLDTDPTLTVAQIKEKLAEHSNNRIATFETLGLK
jgi:hypothetical protein